MIKSWSPSKLQDFDKCKFFCWLKHDQKIPEPERPLPLGKLEHANDRGTRIHDACEQYVRGDSDELPYEAEIHFGPQIDFLRILYAEGKVSLEGNWGMDESWEIAEWDDAWLRLKLDVIVRWCPTHATVIDYKSGRKYGNEIKHAEQMQIYVVTTFLRHPELEVVEVELWYLDQNEVTRMRFTRDQALRFRANFHKRGTALTTCTEWKPNPNKFSCKWCRYDESGHCTVGVK